MEQSRNKLKDMLEEVSRTNIEKLLGGNYEKRITIF